MQLFKETVVHLNSHLTATREKKKEREKRKKKKKNVYKKKLERVASKVRPCPREFLKSHGSSGCSRKDGTAPVREEKGWQRLGGGGRDDGGGGGACVWVRRQCATPRGRPLDGDNAHPFPRLLYVFPPLLRILCRNKFFLRRIKILEGHSEYLCAPILMSLGGNKTAAGPPFVPLRIGVAVSKSSPSNRATLRCSTREPRFEKKSASRRVAGPLAGTTLTFAPVKCYVVLVSRSVRRLSNDAPLTKR